MLNVALIGETYPLRFPEALTARLQRSIDPPDYTLALLRRDFHNVLSPIVFITIAGIAATSVDLITEGPFSDGLHPFYKIKFCGFRYWVTPLRTAAATVGQPVLRLTSGRKLGLLVRFNESQIKGRIKKRNRP